MNYPASFIDTLMEYRLQNNLNLVQLAERLGITEQCLSRWLLEKSVPSLDYLILVADYLHCSLDYLVGRNDNATYTPAKKQCSFTERLNYLLKKNNLSSYKLATDCGFSDAIFAKWKKGKTPKPETLFLLSEYFNVSLDYLVGRSDSV